MQEIKFQDLSIDQQILWVESSKVGKHITLGKIVQGKESLAITGLAMDEDSRGLPVNVPQGVVEVEGTHYSISAYVENLPLYNHNNSNSTYYIVQDDEIQRILDSVNTVQGSQNTYNSSQTAQSHERYQSSPRPGQTGARDIKRVG